MAEVSLVPQHLPCNNHSQVQVGLTCWDMCLDCPHSSDECELRKQDPSVRERVLHFALDQKEEA